MPLNFCDEAFFTAIYLVNGLPRKVIHGSTPLELLFSAKTRLQCLAQFWVCLLAKPLAIQQLKVAILFLTMCFLRV
jgi:hypothetical protein